MYEMDWAVEGQQNVALSDTNRLLAGAEFRHASVNNTDFYDEKKSYENRSLYLQDQWELAPTWQLNTGLRYDNYHNLASRTTGSAAINKKFDEDSHAYFAWNQVFKVPNMDDLYYWSSWGNGAGYFANPNLRPETGNVYTLGWDFKSSPSTDWHVSAFYSNLHDAIRWVTDDYMAYHTLNVRREKKQGFEVSATHKLNDHWDLNASYTYVKVRKDESGDGYVRDLNYAPNYYQFGARYHDDAWNVNLVGRAANGLSGQRYGEIAILRWTSMPAIPLISTGRALPRSITSIMLPMRKWAVP